MAQRRSSAVRESELQPIYELIDAISPARLTASVRRLDRRTRWLIAMLAASLVLIWVIIFAVRLTVNHVRATSGAFLFDALQAPYALQSRAVPMIDSPAEAVLPITISDFQLLPESVEVLPAASAGEVPTDGYQPPAYAALVSAHSVGQCLKAATVADMSCTGVVSGFVTSGVYQAKDGAQVVLAVARFETSVQAREAMKALYQHAAATSKIGNYALSVGAVDFFYSSDSRQYSFTWAHDAWVYSASGDSFQAVENLVKNYLY